MRVHKRRCVCTGEIWCTCSRGCALCVCAGEVWCTCTRGCTCVLGRFGARAVEDVRVCVRMFPKFTQVNGVTQGELDPTRDLSRVHARQNSKKHFFC